MHLALRLGMNLCMVIAILAALSGGYSNSYFTTSPADGTPSIVDVQKAAIEHARLKPNEISSWKKRSRLAPLLPKIQLDYGNRLKNDANVNINDSVYVGSQGSTVGPDENAVSQNINTDQNIGIRAVWSFSDAIFNTDMLAVSEEARMLSRERHAILAEVNKNYYERVRSKGEIKFLEERAKITRQRQELDKIKQDIFTKQVAFDESSAALDALTGGWFSETIRKKEAK